MHPDQAQVSIQLRMEQENNKINPLTTISRYPLIKPRTQNYQHRLCDFSYLSLAILIFLGAVLRFVGGASVRPVKKGEGK